MQRRALITGITGQDGQYLARLLLSHGYEVHGTTRRDVASPFERVAPLGDGLELTDARLDSVELHRLELADIADDDRGLVELLRRGAAHEVYHLAAESFVATSWERPVEVGAANGLAVARLLEAIRQADPAIRFCLAGSSSALGDGALGDGGDTPQNEETPLRPGDPYAASKAYAQWITTAWRARYGLFACTAIQFNHESPLRRPQFLSRKVTDGVARIGLGLARELRLGNLDSHRDWGFAGDHVRAMWQMLQQPQPADFVIASGHNRSVRELVEEAFRCAGLDWEQYVVIDADLVRPADRRTPRADASRARRQLGWEPRVTFEALVAMMVEADLARHRGGKAARPPQEAARQDERSQD